MRIYELKDPIHSVPLHELLDMPVEKWPHGDGFSFQKMIPPVSTAVDYDAVQGGLRNVGLNCAQNNRQNIDRIITGVRSAAPQAGYGLRMTSDSNPPDWHWTIEDEADWSSKMMVCLMKHDYIDKNNLYPVYYKQDSQTYSQSTVVLLGDLFTDVAKIAGDLAHGSVNVDEMVKTISEQVGDLATETESTYHQEELNKTTFFVSLELASDNEASAIAGSIYNYKMDIHDYKNKKSETHEASYYVEQWSLIFTDSDVFMTLYNRVKDV